MGVSSREKAELSSYQLKEVAQVWCTQYKDNIPVESGPIEWKELKKAFLGKYFPHEKKDINIEKFIILRQGNMSMEEYSLKLTLLSKYAPSLVSNPRYEMSRFLTGVSDLVKEERRMIMIHHDMTLSSIIVYT